MFHTSLNMDRCVVVVVLSVLVTYLHGQGVVDQADDGMSGTIKFGPPDMSDEMTNSPFVPDELKCDACRSIAYQVNFLYWFYYVYPAYPSFFMYMTSRPMCGVQSVKSTAPVNKLAEHAAPRYVTLLTCSP